MDDLFIKLLAASDQAGMKIISQIVALSVRNNIENFHVRYLSDSQMKELNPLIRKGVYEALFTLANYNNNVYCQEWINYLARSIPSYWEEPELDKALKEIRDGIPPYVEIDFDSPFLNEQFKLGNLFYNARTGCIEIKPSYEFEDVIGNPHKHRNKISARLRRERYSYMRGLCGYIRRIQ